MASFEGAAPQNYKEGLTAPPKDTRVQTEVSARLFEVSRALIAFARNGLFPSTVFVRHC